MRWPKRLALLASACALVALALPVSATQGVSVDLGRVDVDDPLRAGQRYRLPTLGVSNPGTEQTEYEVRVEAVEGERSAPADWFRLDPGRFGLAPGETQPVEVQLVIPASAEPAHYEQLVSARVVNESSYGVTVGAAAASILQFEVVPSSVLEGTWLSAVSFFRAGHPWTTLVAVAVVVVLVASWIVRRFEFSVRRRG